MKHLNVTYFRQSDLKYAVNDLKLGKNDLKWDFPVGGLIVWQGVAKLEFQVCNSSYFDCCAWSIHCNWYAHDLKMLRPPDWRRSGPSAAPQKGGSNVKLWGVAIRAWARKRGGGSTDPNDPPSDGPVRWIGSSLCFFPGFDVGSEQAESDNYTAKVVVFTPSKCE